VWCTRLDRCRGDFRCFLVSASRVTITGAGFRNGATVALGYVPASIGYEKAVDVQVASDSAIVATTPPHKAGKVDVVVTNPNGETAALTDAFEYK
jgi:hypothetical protein